MTTTDRPKRHEEARTRTWEQAKEVMEALAETKRNKGWLAAWVVMKCELRGKEGREKPVLWYPGEGSVPATLCDVDYYGKASKNHPHLYQGTRRL